MSFLRVGNKILNLDHVAALTYDPAMKALVALWYGAGPPGFTIPSGPDAEHAWTALCAMAVPPPLAGPASITAPLVSQTVRRRPKVRTTR